MNIVFLDRDGTIIAEPPDEQIDSLEKLEYIPGVISGLRLLVDAGFQLVMVSNQDGLGTEQYPQPAYDLVQGKILRLFEGEGISFLKIFICPHTKEENCSCRKPKTGLVDSFLKENSVDRVHSFVLGDRETDVEFARNIGCRAVRLTAEQQTTAEFSTNNFFDACKYIIQQQRTAVVNRITNETKISVSVALDGSGKYSVDTGIGFFDHMVAQLIKHSGIDATISVTGDLNVDEHHSVEDTGLALGEAIREALGTKRGIQRFGFAVPMDEALATVSLDLSGRPFCSLKATFTREKVGEFPTELVEDFFRALADGLRANLHISVTGRNDHHKIESIFKATGQALKQAITRSFRSSNSIPSTKGTL